MFTRHKRAPVGSRMPLRISFPVLSCITICRLSRYAEQSASHSLPRLSRLLVNPGMMCPVRAARVGIAGMAKTAVAEDALASPVAVRIVVRGPAGLMSRSGASVVK